MGTVFQHEKRSPVLDCSEKEVPCKKFKNQEEDNKEPEENNAVALNLAARFLTARAQMIHQQVFLQQKLGLLDPKLSQMIQIAQFQAYLASIASSNKTENSEEGENKSSTT